MTLRGHEAAWAEWRAALGSERMHHAWILAGPRGLGKGTFARLIAKDFSLFHISPGALMRQLVNDQEIQSDARLEYIQLALQSNSLPHDDITMDLIIREYEKKKSAYKGVIFDGFPRTKSHIPLLQEKFDISKFILVELLLSENVLMEKLLGRRECSACQRTYNLVDYTKGLYNIPAILPKTEGQCDDCGGRLIQ